MRDDRNGFGFELTKIKDVIRALATNKKEKMVSLLKSKLSALVMLFLLGLFVMGGFQLFALRFSRGDIYPKYSSLRKDPMGCKVLADSIEVLEGVDVARNYRNASHLTNPSDSCLIMAGASTPDVKMQQNALHDFISSGGRIAICLKPQYWSAQRSRNKAKNEDKPEEITDNTTDTSEGLSDTSEGDHEVEPDEDQIVASLGWKFEGLELVPPEERKLDLHIAPPDASLPGWRQLSLYSYDSFKIDPEQWNVLYSFDGQPVVVERHIGEGSILVATDSYFLSNEGVSKKRIPALLAHVIKDRSIVIFDEFIHGQVENRNIMWLAKRYRLHLLAANLLLIALLFIWRSLTTVSNIPDLSDLNDASLKSDLTNHTGLQNLLKRNIAPSKLIKMCFGEWLKTASQHHISKEKFKEVEELMCNFSEAKNSVDVYNKSVEIMNRKKS